ncbi:MAG: DUF1992 domain-containing protein [Geodermatophilaceae bacterium]|nr:DUF1992 domain-containing protein [Geodermatophilaceae bacterium]
MTERKPAGMPFETWVDRAIREADERGEFTDLPGAGKPIPGAGQPDDELWWVKAKLRREKLTFIPPSLALRKDVEEIHDRAAQQCGEADVRRLVDDLNARIRIAIRTGIAGPAITVMPLDPDQVVATWRERRTPAADATTGTAEPRPTQPARQRWFRGRRRS